MDFVLFLLTNFTLFVRPAELIPALGSVRIYNYLMLSSLFAAGPRIIDQFQLERLTRRPISLCVLGMLPAVIASHAVHLNQYRLQLDTPEFTKVILYYLLLVATVNSTVRMRQFVYWTAIFAAITCLLAVLNYFEVITIEGLTFVDERATDATTGERFVAVRRLCGTGIFNDPNDLSMIAVFGILICLFGLGDRLLGGARLLWIAPMGVFLTAFALTRSRGGLLALVGGLAVLLYHRFGLMKAVLLLGLFVPPALLALGGRQTSVGSGMSGGTGEARVALWSEGLQLFKQAPLFGIGYGMYDEYATQVAHNSFVHTFTELGLFGGTLFLGAFYFSANSAWTMGRRKSLHAQLVFDPTLRRFAPYLMGILAGWCVSMMSLSRAYAAPTYMVLGVTATYCVQVERIGLPPIMQFNSRQVGRLAVASVAFLAMIYVFIRITLR